MSASPFDHPILSGLLGDAEIAALFTAEAEIAGMIAFETALAEAEAAEGLIPTEAGGAIAARLAHIALDIPALRAGAARDGVVVPDLVRQLRAGIGEPHGRHLHFGATSQDAVDTSLALRLKQAAEIFDSRLDTLVKALDALEARDGAVETMGHTRMQAAIAVPASRKILSWRDPLVRHRQRLPAVIDEVALLHLGGAAGTLDKLGGKAEAVTARMAAALGLNAVARPRHSERDGIAAFASWLSLATGSLGKLGQDVALMAQTEIGEVKLASGGGSSAMPHKVNPVGAEVLVTLARFNATLVSAMHQSLVHENERSGSAWMLEWMVLPQMTVATAAALETARTLVENIRFASD
jgi:3-carboxy-cis,cis-muconate cycloisomerase